MLMSCNIYPHVFFHLVSCLKDVYCGNINITRVCSGNYTSKLKNHERSLCFFVIFARASHESEMYDGVFTFSSGLSPNIRNNMEFVSPTALKNVSSV